MSFFIVYLIVYGAMNGYLFVKLAMLVSGRLPLKLALAAWMTFMVAGWFLGFWLEDEGYVLSARILAWLRYLWMPIVFWFLFYSLVVDLWNAGVWVVRRTFPGAAAWRVPLRAQMIAFGVLASVAMLWGLVEARLVRTVELELRSERISPDADPVTVAFITDVHFGLIERDTRARQIARMLNRIKPDVIVSSGDMLDADPSHLMHLAEHFRDLRPPLGKFAVLGNHEWYVGAEQSIRWHEAADFTMLRERSEMAGSHLMIAGVDDPSGRYMGQRTMLDESKALPAAADRPAVILLKHQPTIESSSLGRFDLMLSGHTHAGQIFPFGLLVRMRFPYLRGWYELERGSAVYTSPGTGTWGPPLRVFARPEITLITLRPATSGQAQSVVTHAR